MTQLYLEAPGPDPRPRGGRARWGSVQELGVGSPRSALGPAQALERAPPSSQESHCLFTALQKQQGGTCSLHPPPTSACHECWGGVGGPSCISGGGCVWVGCGDLAGSRWVWQLQRWERGQPAGLWAGSGGSCGEEGVVCCVPAVDNPLHWCQSPIPTPSRTILTSVWVQV